MVWKEDFEACFRVAFWHQRRGFEDTHKAPLCDRWRHVSAICSAVPTKLPWNKMPTLVTVSHYKYRVEWPLQWTERHSMLDLKMHC